MPSERTFFNKAIYKRALSRFWLIGAAYAAVLCFLTLMCGRYFNFDTKEIAEYVSYSILSNLTRREIVAAAVAAVLTEKQASLCVLGSAIEAVQTAFCTALSGAAQQRDESHAEACAEIEQSGGKSGRHIVKQQL